MAGKFKSLEMDSLEEQFASLSLPCKRSLSLSYGSPKDQPLPKRLGGLAPLSVSVLNANDSTRPCTPRAGLLHTPLAAGTVPSAPRSKRSERRTEERYELPRGKIAELSTPASTATQQKLRFD